MATKPFLVVILSRETSLFGDEIHSRRHFLAGKLHLLATRLILVTFLRRKMLYFGDEIHSRHHFKPETPFFWRRGPFSSSF
ncbi:hypothetical protein NSQ82_17185 [Caldifermentibacillus hisashii]|uniref:hypothetical protein n=1 Tax=Caldifermentibacillus hisashii TaxID=996558 RepID=UPI0031B6FE7E